MNEVDQITQVSAFIAKKLAEMSDLKREKSKCERRLEQLSEEIGNTRTTLSSIEEKIRSVKYEVCESCERLDVTVLKSV